MFRQGITNYNRFRVFFVITTGHTNKNGCLLTKGTESLEKSKTFAEIVEVGAGEIVSKYG